MIKKCSTAIALLFLAVSMLIASDPVKKKEQKENGNTTDHKVEKPTEAVTAGGMVFTTEANRDGEGLSPELIQALDQIINTSHKGLVEKQRSNGTVTVDLKGRFHSATVATIDAEGKVQTTCLSSAPGHEHGHDKAKKEEVKSKKSD